MGGVCWRLAGRSHQCHPGPHQSSFQQPCFPEETVLSDSKLSWNLNQATRSPSEVSSKSSVITIIMSGQAPLWRLKGQVLTAGSTQPGSSTVTGTSLLPDARPATGVKPTHPSASPLLA